VRWRTDTLAQAAHRELPISTLKTAGKRKNMSPPIKANSDLNGSPPDKPGHSTPVEAHVKPAKTGVGFHLANHSVLKQSNMPRALHGKKSIQGKK
jgi:hypothetical protein